MKIKLMPHPFRGMVRGVSSKSVLHRMLICAAFSDQPTEIIFDGMGEDVQATISCLRQLGMETEPMENGLRILPAAEGYAPKGSLLNCKESGSTLRFLLPAAAAVTGDIRLTGEGRLLERPLKELLICLKDAGKSVDREKLPVHLTGRIQTGEFAVPADISSQYVSGLLLMGPMLKEDIKINMTTELKSAPYVEMTREIMKDFGVEVEGKENSFLVAGRQGYHSPGRVWAEGDWSNAAFFLVANAMGQQIEIPMLSMGSRQGDREVMPIMKRMVEQEQRRIDLSDIPDLAAPLAVLAAVTPGCTVFERGENLRMKESDRILSVVAMIRNLGGSARETADGFIIEGTGLTGGTVDSCGDHRIAMAAAVASCRCREPVIIENPMVVNKSYPHFYEEITKIGGEIEWMN